MSTVDATVQVEGTNDQWVDDGFVEWRVNGVHSNNTILRFRGVCKTDKITRHKVKVDLNFLL